MGIIISIEEFRKKRCLQALMERIGLPEYCQECDTCGDEILDLLADEADDLDELGAILSEEQATPRAPARMLAFTAPAPHDAPLPSSRPRRRP